VTNLAVVVEMSFNIKVFPFVRLSTQLMASSNTCDTDYRQINVLCGLVVTHKSPISLGYHKWDQQTSEPAKLHDSSPEGYCGFSKGIFLFF
jgi:hypothetical protein